jgi:hypothetical protein
MIRSPALRMASRRFESTAASKATEAAKETATKAQQGLSRVTSAAGPAIVGAARGVGNALGKIGGRTGRLIGFVERESWMTSRERICSHRVTEGTAFMLTNSLAPQAKPPLLFTTPRSAPRLPSWSFKARR